MLKMPKDNRALPKDNIALLNDYKKFPGHKYYEHPLRVLPVLLGQGLLYKDKLLDVGCGPLRTGRILIHCLAPGHYFGIEPEKDILMRALEEEIGIDVATRKTPRFLFNDQFDPSPFNERFDMIFSDKVFIHCSRDQFRLFLKNTKPFLRPSGKIIVSLYVGDTGKEIPKDGENFCYRYAKLKGIRYAKSELDQILHEFGYVGKNIQGFHWQLKPSEYMQDTDQ